MLNDDLGYDVYHDKPITMKAEALLKIGVAIHLILDETQYQCPYSEELYDALGLIEVALANTGAVIKTRSHDDLRIIRGEGGIHESE